MASETVPAAPAVDETLMPQPPADEKLEQELPPLPELSKPKSSSSDGVPRLEQDS
jgi:hypothetical protein